MSEKLSPAMSERDIKLGVRSYLRYAAGIATIVSPGKMQPLHNREAVTHAEEIVAYGAHLMIEGTVGVITYAQPADMRSRLTDAGPRYEMAVDPMIAIVEAAYSKESSRQALREMNEVFEELQPFAALREVTYHNVCHSRWGRIPVLELLDGFVPEQQFQEIAAAMPAPPLKTGSHQVA